MLCTTAQRLFVVARQQRADGLAVPGRGLQRVFDLAHERVGRGREDFLPKLQQELIAVVARYVAVDPEKVVVNLERGQGMSALEINIELPGNGTAGRSAAA